MIAAAITVTLWIAAIAAATGILHWRRTRRVPSGGGHALPRDGWQECSCGWCVHPRHHLTCACCGKPVKP